MESKPSTLKITYIDGVSLSYEIAPEKAAEYNLAEKIEQLMGAKSFTLEIDGKLFMIPTTSIRTIEFNPAPATLPPLTVQGLTAIL